MAQTRESFSVTITKMVTLPYWLYLPNIYKRSKKPFPLLIFLHGAGERGDDLTKVLKHGPPKEVAKGRDFPFIIASPQCPEDAWWHGELEALEKFLEHLKKNLRIDQQRIYLTGLSMGGFGTWHWAARNPEHFAAIAPICGGGHPWTASNLKDLPIWAFHGALDQVVPLGESERMVEAVTEAGGSAKFTIYPKADHDSWTVPYRNKALYSWFLKYSRP